MLFNSLSFLVFFPIVTLAYYLIPRQGRVVWLLAASYFFYMCWNAGYALLLAASTLITYASGLLIERAGENKGKKKLWAAASLISNLAILFFFKYFTFAAGAVQSLFSLLHLQLNTPQWDILLPVGISFYTFQALSYTMDVYSGRVKAEHNILKYALFVGFYPQLVAGPIERSSHLLRQIGEDHPLRYENVKTGFLRMLWGYFEKLLIANQAAILVDAVYNDYSAATGCQIVLATVLFAFQIYCDFDGYSNIAVGAARVMGFELMDNFRQPYFADSVKDFWRRWHISLSTWFRDYLYIPLGGSRCSKLRRYFNVMVTFLVSGLWHGAAWHFVVWGGLNGAFQVAGDLTAGLRARLTQGLHLKKNSLPIRLVRGIFTFVLVDFAWLFFRAAGMGDALQMLRRVATQGISLSGLLDGSLFTLGLTGWQLVLLALALGLLLCVDLARECGISVRGVADSLPTAVRWACCLGVCFVLIVHSMAAFGGEAAGFIYFQF